MEIRAILAANLRAMRRAQGLSQEELAHRAGIDRTYISSLERSVYAAGIDVVDRLARALEMEAADLLKAPLRRTSAKGRQVAPRSQLDGSSSSTLGGHRRTIRAKKGKAR